MVKKAAKKKAPAKKKRVIKKPSRPDLRTLAFNALKYWIPRLAVIVFIFVLGFSVYLDTSIRKKFEGQKWALPAHVYTRPLELYLGQDIELELIKDELRELGYQARDQLGRVGSYKIDSQGIAVYQREFRFWDGLRPAQRMFIKMSADTITDIALEDSSGELKQTEIVRLEPRLFGSVSPLSHEDRTLLALEDVPKPLIDALIATEDRAFYSHFGINPLGIARAMIRNIRAGRVVQGGSTLTQQLVKNYYLYSDQTYTRKFVEMIMAVLLELHYSKDEILEAYINEVYLSQAGNRAIHGFELASRYFFGQPLAELELDQIALLAAINNGPSFYNPIRNPERALKKRNLVLRTMFQQGLLEESEFQSVSSSPLNIGSTAERAAPLSYPAFMGVVRSNLTDQYQQQDLNSAGLQIYTTLNPRIQHTLEKSITVELAAIEKQRSIDPDSLQVAAAVIRTDNGELVALSGDRKASFSGFNRALQSRRPVGSLLKPFVYLTALENAEEYSLASLIDDKKITVSQRGSPDWQPQNYDGLEHGQVMLIDALARSYNLATVQLGMRLGVDRVAKTIRRVGYKQNVSELPSVLLGAVPMNVMDVGQLYLTLASGGFKTPVKSIRSVLSNDDEPLTRYPLVVEQVVEPEFNSLITYALQEAVRSGTGRSVLNGFKYDYALAGKTGTTNDYRDSWFAGFSGNYLTVIWIGRDDNKPTSLTGASGAAKVWSRVMRGIPQRRLELAYHDEIVPQLITYSRDPDALDCSLTRQLPMLLASLPALQLPCLEKMQYDQPNEDELRHFEPAEPRERAITEPEKPKKKSFWKRIFG